MKHLLSQQSYKRIVDQLQIEISKAEDCFNKLKEDSQQMEQGLLGYQSRLKSETDKGKDQYLSRSTGSKHTFYDEYFQKYDFGHAPPASDHIFFEGPSAHAPYKFNYNKIFDLGPRNVIKDAVANALKVGSKVEMTLDHGRAVRECCKDMWTTEVQKFNEDWEEKQKALKNQPQPLEETGLGFDLPYYDPGNKKLMNWMLYKAIQEMKRNKKFVLATFPDAHKIPILKVWIRKRYGFKFSKKERIEAFKLSKKVFYVLKKNGINIRIPILDDLSKERYVSYGCRDYLFRKVRKEIILNIKTNLFCSMLETSF